MNTKSEIGEVNAQLRDELKEHGDMDYEIMSRSIGERDDALDERAAVLDRRAAVLDERAAALDERAAALDERDDALDERDDALDERAEALDERDGDETAHPPFGCAPACILARADELNEGDLLIINGGLVVLSRQSEGSAVHMKSRADGIDIDVRRLDNVEPQLLIPYSQPASKTSEENAAAKKSPQSGNGVKDRISGLMGKISVGLQTISSMITIWGFPPNHFPMGFGMFGAAWI